MFLASLLPLTPLTSAPVLSQLLTPLRLPCFSLSTSETLLPRGLCTCHFFCLVSLDIYMAPSLISFRSWLSIIFSGRSSLAFTDFFNTLFPSQTMYASRPLTLLYSSYRHFDKHKIIYILLLYRWYPSSRTEAYKVRNYCFVHCCILRTENHTHHLVGA